MRGLRYLSAGLAAAMLTAQPCWAAEDEIRDSGGLQSRRAAFAGLNVSLPLGGAQFQKPSIRLQATTTSSILDAHGHRTIQSDRAPGLEISLGKAGKPNIYVGGRNIAELDQKLPVRGDTGTVLLIGGTVVFIVALVIIAKNGVGSPLPSGLRCLGCLLVNSFSTHCRHFILSVVTVSKRWRR